MNTITIIGFGVMGKQIAALLITIGFNVDILTKSSTSVDPLFSKNLTLMKRTFIDDKTGSINFLSCESEIKDTIIIETVSEDIHLKKELYKRISRFTNKEYCTNSSSLVSTEIHKNAIGFHFFNPIYLFPIIEIHAPNNISNSTDFECLLHSLKKASFSIIEVSNTRGYFGNSLIFSHISTVFKLIEKHNANYIEIEKMFKLLYNQNIFTTIDIIGIDTAFEIIKNLNLIDSDYYVPEIFTVALRKHILGKKNNTSIKSLITKSI